jgi:hypothetical protein
MICPPHDLAHGYTKARCDLQQRLVGDVGLPRSIAP